jgi:bifunctional non-homologous end joining protein LigD
MIRIAITEGASIAPTFPAIAAPGSRANASIRAEFVIVGGSDPEGARPLLGALLLGYYEPDRGLIYAGRVGTGMPVKTLVMLDERLRPLAIETTPLAKAPPRRQRFGGPLALSKVHWVRPDRVAEIMYLSWLDDGLLRRAVLLGWLPSRRRRRAVGGASALISALAHHERSAIDPHRAHRW